MSEVKSFIIRPAQEDDLEQIARIEIESAKNEGRLEPLGYTVKEMHKLWKKRLRSGDFDILAAANADNDSHVLGFIGVQAHQGKPGFIQAIYVDPAFYRHGVGKALLNLADRLFRMRRCPHAYLYLEPLNHKGRLFYSSAGYLTTNKRYRHLQILSKEFGSC